MARKDNQKRITQVPVQMRAAAEDGAPSIIEGVACTMGQRTLLWEWGSTRVFEEIAPGAFDNVLENDVRCLFNHNPNALLGRTKSGTCRLKVVGSELRFETDLAGTQIAKDVAEHIQREDVTGCSFAFNIKSETRTDLDGGDILYVVNEVSQLFDVGPVTYPAYPEGTSVSSRDREDLLEELKRREEKPKGRSLQYNLNKLRMLELSEKK